MTTQNASSKFFDLHISGIGYLNRIREVKPKKGDSFWACDIAALNGPADDVGYTRFDCRISGREAEKLVRRCRQAVDEDRKVLVGFKLGDLWTDTFIYKRGQRQGETGVSLKARLLFISWIKVNGEMVYQAPRRDDDQIDSQSQGEPNQEQTVSQQTVSPAPETHTYTGHGHADMSLGSGAAGSFESPVTH